MVSLPDPPFRVGLIGAGSVGTGVATLLQRAGYAITGVASRTQESAERAARRLNAPVTSTLSDLKADVFLIGTGLDAVAAVAETLATIRLDGKIVCHFAGSAGVEPLSATIDAGASACAIHPVQACPDTDAAIARLPGSAWGVTCSPGATRWVERMIVEDLKGQPVIVPEKQRTVWHASAVITSNGIAGLLATGEELLAAIGIEDPQNVLGPLAQGTVSNAIEGGGAAATLTGPVVRGEIETIESHLRALADLGREYSDAYRLVSRLLILPAARRAGRMDDVAEEAVTEALEP